MDINKFKSVAVRKPDYNLLQGLCTEKFRSPASMISKLVNEYVGYQAKKKNMSVEAYKKQILKTNGKAKNGKRSSWRYGSYAGSSWCF